MTTNLPDIIVANGLPGGPVTVFPLFTRASTGLDYRLGVDAMADGSITLGEIGRGTVSAIRAHNQSRQRVLFVDGDHLVGARQNRAVIASAVIGAGQQVDLPVCCVEEGRWHPTSEHFRPAVATVASNVRGVIKTTLTSALYGGHGRHAEQSRVWRTIARNEQPRRSLYDSAIYDSSLLVERVRRIPSQPPRYVPQATGVAVAIHRRIVSLDVFDKPSTCEAYWRRLLVGLPFGPGFDDATAGDVYNLVDALVSSSWSEFPSVGCGREKRTRIPTATASTIELDDQVVHLGVAALH
jgi:hypothetical protein